MKHLKNGFLIQLILILAVASNAIAQDYSTYDSCAEQDSLALVAFFNATGGPNWITQTYEGDEYPIDLLGDDVKEYYSIDYPNAGRGKWLVGPVKDWFGVLLEKQQIGNTNDSVWRVIHLHPTDNRRAPGDINLVGYVPKEVGLLTALEWFKINGNIGLKGTEIPDEIYHPTLEKFDIEGVYFKGNISSAYRNCVNLDYINIRYNHLDSIPTHDFLSAEHLINAFAETGQTIWFYDNQFSWATLYPTVKYFMGINSDIEYEARYQNNVGRSKEIILQQGSSVTLTSNEAGEGGTYTWYKNGVNTYITGSEYTTSDTGLYKASVYNAYIAENAVDDITAYDVKAYTAPIHVVYAPVQPKCIAIKTSYSGLQVIMEFDKEMAISTSIQVEEFNVLNGSSSISGTTLERKGWIDNKLVLTLEEPLSKDSTILVSYSTGSITCSNGGALSSFSNFEAQNLVRSAPTLNNAITSSTGENIVLTFNNYIDAASLNKEDFTVYVNNTTSLEIADISIKEGKYDQSISKEVTLILNTYPEDSDKIIVSYDQGSLTGLYGGVLASFSNIDVENIIVATRVSLTLKVIDGSGSLNNVIVKSSMKSQPFELYNNGNEDNNVWFRELSVSPGTYEWQVYSRTYEYDTITQGDTIVILPDNNNFSDSLLSPNLLYVSCDTNNISGDTIFNYYNYSVTFRLDMSDYLSNNPNEELDPYLMGIDDDWTLGIELTPLNTENDIFITTITNRNIGEIIQYNFRNGDVWENNTPTYRQDTIFGNNTISAKFGVDIPSTIDTNSKNIQKLVLSPNPATDFLNIQSPIEPAEIIVYNLLGGRELLQTGSKKTIDLGTLNSGIYILQISDTKQNIYTSRFIKK